MVQMMDILGWRWRGGQRQSCIAVFGGRAASKVPSNCSHPSDIRHRKQILKEEVKKKNLPKIANLSRIYPKGKTLKQNGFICEKSQMWSCGQKHKLLVKFIKHCFYGIFDHYVRLKKSLILQLCISVSKYAIFSERRGFMDFKYDIL